MGERPIYAFGPFQFDTQSWLLTRDSEVIPLTRKAAEVLHFLIERREHLVTKENLLDRVWQDVTVQENTVTFHIRLVRRALGDGAGTQAYIKTYRQRGYQLIVPVAVV